MNNTVDLHTHILPMVDDGADSFEDALQMISFAAANGTTAIVCTPHYLTPDMRNKGLSKSALVSRFEDFKEKAYEKYPEIELLFGAEVFAATNILDVISENKLITLNGTSSVLLEFPFDDSEDRALGIVKEIISGGYSVIIAHPERYDFICRNPRAVVPFLQAGALLQINATSLIGKAGFVAQDVALSFVENNLAAVIASDAHSIVHRPPDLSEAYTLISSEFSFEYADALFYNNPSAILRGRKFN